MRSPRADLRASGVAVVVPTPTARGVRGLGAGMKLKITSVNKQQHKDIATAVGWSFANELLSCSDDKSIWRWSMNAEPVGQLIAMDAYVTKLDWFPAIAGKTGRKEQEIFAISCTDGTVKLVSKSGRVEKSVDAHTGAVVALRWNHDGTALATCGEDGAVKVWSRAGMLRATIAQLGAPARARRGLDEAKSGCTGRG